MMVVPILSTGSLVDTMACNSYVMHEGHLETEELGHGGHSLGAESTERSEGPGSLKAQADSKVMSLA